jgi:cell division protein FtsQ
VTTTYQPTEQDEDTPPPRAGRRRGLILLVVAVLVVLAVFGTWLVAFSSVFGVRTVTVRGARSVSAATIEAAAAVPRGTPLVRLDTTAIALRVDALSGVASAQVTTSFPSTVIITVAERVPVGYVVVSGRDMLVDRTGLQYVGVDKAPADLPRFVVPAGTSSRTTGGAVATVAGALSPVILAKIASIEALDPGSITLVLSDGRTVQWGSAAQSAAKARVLPALLDQKGQQLDVTDPSRPFTR